MNTCFKGSLGEAKVLAKLIENNWGVFIPFSGHAPFDLIGINPITNQMFRISVKSRFGKNKQGAYDIRLSQVCMTSVGPKVSDFDPNSCDIVACYLSDLDKVCFVATKQIKTKTVVTFRTENVKSNVTGTIRLVNDYLLLP